MESEGEGGEYPVEGSESETELETTKRNEMGDAPKSSGMGENSGLCNGVTDGKFETFLNEWMLSES